MGKYSKLSLHIMLGIIGLGAVSGIFHYCYYNFPSFYSLVNTTRYACAWAVASPNHLINTHIVNKTLIGKRCRLELLAPEHFDKYAEAFSQRVKNYLDLPPSTGTKTVTEWLKLELAKQYYGRQLTYVVISPQNEIAGSLSISKVPLPDYGQIFGWLNEKHWGSGMTQEALKLGLTEYFRVTKDHESNAYIRPFNVRCYLALKKIGFVTAGRSTSPATRGSYILKITENTIKNLPEKPLKTEEKVDVDGK